MSEAELGFDVIAEPGALGHLPKLLRDCAIRKPFVIVDPDIMGGPLFDSFKAVVPNDLIATVFADVPREPDEESVIAAQALYRATRSDGLVVYGNRASLDLGKAVLLSVSQEGPLSRYDFRGTNPKEINADKPPFIAIPVPIPKDHREGVRETAFITLRKGRVIALSSPNLTPKKVILDLAFL